MCLFIFGSCMYLFWISTQVYTYISLNPQRGMYNMWQQQREQQEREAYLFHLSTHVGAVEWTLSRNSGATLPGTDVLLHPPPFPNDFLLPTHRTLTYPLFRDSCGITSNHGKIVFALILHVTEISGLVSHVILCIHILYRSIHNNTTFVIIVIINLGSYTEVLRAYS